MSRNPLPIAQGINMGQVFSKYELQRNAETLKDVTAFWDAAWQDLEHGSANNGECLPWQKTTDHFRFRPGELTVWAGVNGNGKSLVMGQVALWLERPVVIASLEMPPVKTVTRMIRQATGLRRPSRQYYDEVITGLHNHIFIYDKVGRIKDRELYGLLHYASVEHDCGHLMIDSLVKLGYGDDYNRQVAFIDTIQQLAKEHRIHVHLVHHMRKGSDETQAPDKYSVKGAGEIVDLADNLLIVHRNLRKEKLRRTNDAAFNAEEPDGFIRVAKQRHGEWEGLFSFWFHADSQQWIPRNINKPMPWPGP